MNWLGGLLIVMLIVFALALVTGCAELQTAKGEIVKRGAEFSDQAAEDAEFIICHGITVGTWQRKYGTNAERAAAWRALCSQQINVTP